MVLLDFESGHAFVGHMSLSLKLTEISGEIHLNSPNGPILRPVSVSERLRLVQFALSSNANSKGTTNSKTLLAAAILQQATILQKSTRQFDKPEQLKNAYQAIALHLAGAGNQGPGLYESISLVANHTGWLPEALFNSDANQIDHIAIALSPPTSNNWTRLLLVDKTANEPAFLCDRLAQDLLERADTQLMSSSPNDSVSDDSASDNSVPNNSVFNDSSLSGLSLKKIVPTHTKHINKPSAESPPDKEDKALNTKVLNTKVLNADDDKFQPNGDKYQQHQQASDKISSSTNASWRSQIEDKDFKPPTQSHDASIEINKLPDIQPNNPIKKSISKAGSNIALSKVPVFENTVSADTNAKKSAFDNVLSLSRHQALHKTHPNSTTKALETSIDNTVYRDGHENTWQINQAEIPSGFNTKNTLYKNDAHINSPPKISADTGNSQKTNSDIFDFFKPEETNLADKLASELNREADLRGID